MTLAPRIDQPMESESKMPIYHEVLGNFFPRILPDNFIRILHFFTPVLRENYTSILRCCDFCYDFSIYKVFDIWNGGS